MPRPKKDTVQEAVQFVEETQAVKHEPVKAKVDVKALQGVIWNTKLETMQDTAVKAVPKGIDAATDEALADVLKAKDSGIAAQYLQQIIARHG